MDIKEGKKNNSIVILFGSRSQKKVKAVKAAAEKIFKKKKVELLLYDVSSDINSQPLGEQETIQGAINRLENTIKAHEGGKDSSVVWDYVIGIENGIINIKNTWLTDSNGNDDKYLDLAYITLQHKSTGLKLIEQSASVEFPREPVQTAIKEGVNKYTAAEFMSDFYISKGVDATNLDTKDPHKFLLDFTTTRMDIITSSVEIILSRSLAIVKNGKE